MFHRDRSHRALKTWSRIAAALAILLSLTSLGARQAGAEAGVCNVTGVLCMNSVGVTGPVSGAGGQTYRFASSDSNLNDNLYVPILGASVGNNVLSVRNRASAFPYACGYNGTGFGAPALWLVDFASSNGFLSVTQGSESFRFRTTSPPACY